MKNYDQSIEIIHSPNWPYILDHPHRILILGGSGSGKTNALLNLIKNQMTRYSRNLLKHSKIHSNQNINCWLTEEKK